SYHLYLPSFPTRRSSDLILILLHCGICLNIRRYLILIRISHSRKRCSLVSAAGWGWDISCGSSNSITPVSSLWASVITGSIRFRSEEHTSELQSRENLVC